MPGGRGLDEDYIDQASKAIKDGLDDSFENTSNECKAAFVAGSFATYAANIVPTNFVEDDYIERPLEIAKKMIGDYFDKDCDEVKAAVMFGVYSIYEASIISSYDMRVESY